MKWQLSVAMLLLGTWLPSGASGQTLAAETRQGLELRERLGVQSHTSSSTIWVFSEAAHHTHETFARVATRDEQGLWSVSGVGEEGPALLRIEQRIIPEERKTLSIQDSRQLDRLLARDSLFLEKSPRQRDVGVGAAFHTMEIITPDRHTVIRWTGRLRGKTGAVADLIMGHSD